MQPRIKKLIHILSQNSYVHIIFLTCIIAGTQWYNRGIFGDPDAQYHLTVAKIMPLWPSAPHFAWLPFTSWGSAYADQHYLFHLFLKPLVLLHAGQAVIVLGFLINILGFNWLLSRVITTTRAPWLWLYTLGSADLFTRISLVKAEATSMTFLYVLTGLLLQKRWAWLFPAMTLYTLWYGASTFFLVIVAGYCLVELITKKTILLKPVYWTLTGLAAGILLHPYRTTLPALLYDQITRAGLLREIPGGNEWYAQPAAFLPDNIIIFVPWILSLIYLYTQRKIATHTLWFIATCSGILFFLALYSNRLTLYWVPYALLVTAAILPLPLKNAYENLRNSTGQGVRKALLLTLLIFACLRGVQNALNITGTIHRIGLPVTRLRNAAEWLSAHTKPNDIVTNASWHIFPELFYWNTQNRYIAGEDPAFLWIADPTRYVLWNELSGQVSSQTLITTLTTFNSTWFIQAAHIPPPLDSTRLKIAYADNFVYILHLAK